ncbi:ABC transporter substrate-binding protein/permease [Kozakia baliensis]|uniref:Amino acid ABC transporter permease n=1 Tax=Kozakia baliensis TaxID=153496 RepID=A0A1D8URA2_9PROT|nr:ABC transporter substrate-binding protein/permease [Kozakia baliensis]AOX16173.1 amino acid ABC transporter permease [Kozakia baliensis]GBR28033.1 amino acid ABC transporter permease [Kozakia baliensis NRIC 0488]GEL63802.1 amino acid ABC transporter permease [Kozakia baliensis]
MRWLLLLWLSVFAIPHAQAQEVLNWASDGEANVPYVFHDPVQQSRLEGFEYEIVQELGNRLHMTPHFIQNDWDGLVPGLQRGMYQMVIDGIEMTPEHREAVLFSRPYYVTGERIILRRDETGLDTVEALRGHTVGTIKDTLAERILSREPKIAIRSYEEETNAFSDLHNGRLDAILLDEPIAMYYGAITDELKLVGEPIGRTQYGIAFKPGNYALRDKVDRALTAMMADGTLQTILARWNLWTPEMAKMTGDFSKRDITPIEWNHYRQAMDRHGGWSIFWRYIGFLPLVLHGAWMTLAVSALAMVLAVGLGLLLALARHYGPKALGLLAGVYIEIVRGTPLLIQVLFIFYGLPALGIRLSPFVAGVLALGLNYAAYEAENYRAGLLSVPRGQMEAAIALNMTHAQALRLIIVPQAFRTVVPVMTNDFISLLKDSSLVSVITLTELSQTYVRLSSTYYDYIGTGLIIGAAYLLLGLPFVRLARYAERRLGRGMTRTGHH